MAAAKSTGEEVLEVAMSMERVGKDFYQALALGSDDQTVCRFCLAAARDEARHYDSFNLIRHRLSGSSATGSLGQNVLAELQSLAKQQIQPDPSAVRKVAIGGKLDDALKMASDMERDAITFYQGLLGRLPSVAGILSQIIAEENSHLRGLMSLTALQTKVG